MRITDFINKVSELDFDFEIDGNQVRIYQKTETMKYLVATVNTKIDYCYSINQVVCPKKDKLIKLVHEFGCTSLSDRGNLFKLGGKDLSNFRVG